MASCPDASLSVPPWLRVSFGLCPHLNFSALYAKPQPFPVLPNPTNPVIPLIPSKTFPECSVPGLVNFVNLENLEIWSCFPPSSVTKTSEAKPDKITPHPAFLFTQLLIVGDHASVMRTFSSTRPPPGRPVFSVFKLSAFNFSTTPSLNPCL